MSNQYFRVNYSAAAGGDISADQVEYDNAISGLTADNVQDAIDEVQGNVESEAIARQNADATLQDNIDDEEAARIAADQDLQDQIDNLPDPMEYKGLWNATTNSPALTDGTGNNGDVYYVSVAGTQFTPAITFNVGDKAVYNGNTAKYEKWDTTDEVNSVFGRIGAIVATSGDYTASQITNVPSGNLAATNVQTALNELQTDIDTRALDSALTAHINDTTDAHDASAISNIPAGGIAATDVQAAINELDTEKFNSADFNSSFDTRLATKSTTNLLEGSNLYFTDERVDDRVAALVVAGTGITSTYDDVANTLTIATTITQYTDELAQDAVGTILTDSNTIDFTYSDATPSIVADVKTQMSITSDSSGIKLSGDASTPGNTKYYGTNGSGTKGYYDIPAVGAAGDIQETLFSFSNNVGSPTDVTAFTFSNGVVRSFFAIVSVYIDATSDVFEEFELNGIQKGADWDLSIESVGDDSDINFTITTAGQIQYTSPNSAGFSAGTMKFRALTTSV